MTATMNVEEKKEELTSKIENYYKEGVTVTTKHFKDILDEAIAYGKSSALAEVEIKGIGFLRQWLNEDRITETKCMVNDEQIGQFLSISSKRGESGK